MRKPLIKKTLSHAESLAWDTIRGVNFPVEIRTSRFITQIRQSAFSRLVTWSWSTMGRFQVMSNMNGRTTSKW